MSNDHSLRVYDSILGLLSSEENPTPLVLLNRVVPFRHARVYAKLEWYNPFGAVKDRIGIHMVRDAEERGVLSPGKRLVEATSGNTGLGLAMAGNSRGYPLQTPLSSEIPLEKRTILRFFGAEVVEVDDSLCPAPGAPEGAIAKAREAARTQPDTVLLDQYANPANPDAHYRTTGPEIWRQTEGRVTHFVAGLGTCGTITGTGRFLKEKKPDVRMIAVFPEEGHSIPGVRSRRQLDQTRFYNPASYDAECEITNREAFDLCLRLNREECVIAGPSSAMALAGALRCVPDTPGTLAVVIFPDNVFKYASTMSVMFPELFPAGGAGADGARGDGRDGSGAGSAAPAASKNDQFVAALMENLKNPYDSISVNDLAAAVDSGDRDGGVKPDPAGSVVNSAATDGPPLIVDIRPPERFAEGRIRGSISIPEDDLARRASALPSDRNAPIVMVCEVGKFSKRAALYLKSMGYREVRSLKGGIGEWVRKGKELESGEGAGR